MGFIQREIERLEKVINENQITTKNEAEGSKADRYFKAHAARQALVWALDPKIYRSPYAAITEDNSTNEFKNEPAEQLI